jgi:lauroyl/myristoyl acyltransferase
VPVTPVFARWDGAAVEVVCGEPIAAREDEAAMAAAMADAIDRWLREHPAAIGDHLLRHLTRQGAATSP